MISRSTLGKVLVIFATYCTNIINSLDLESINPAIPNFVGPAAALSKNIVLAAQTNVTSLPELKCVVTSSNCTATQSSESITHKETEAVTKCDTDDMKITRLDENVINSSAAVINGSNKQLGEKLKRNKTLASVKEIKNDIRMNLTSNDTDCKFGKNETNKVEDKSLRNSNKSSICEMSFDERNTKNMSIDSHLFPPLLHGRSNPRHSRSAGKRVKMLAPDNNKYLENEMDDDANISKKYEKMANLLDLVIEAVGPDERSELGILRKSKLSDTTFMQNNNDEKIEKTINQMVGFVKDSLRDQMNKHSMPLPMELHSFLIWLLHGSEGSEWFPPTVQDSRSKTYYLFHENSHEPHLSRKSLANSEATIDPPPESYFGKSKLPDRSDGETFNKIPAINNIDRDKINITPLKIGNKSHDINYKTISDKLPGHVGEQNVSNSLALLKSPFKFTSDLHQGYDYPDSQMAPLNDLVTDEFQKQFLLRREEKSVFDGNSKLQILNNDDDLKDAENNSPPINTLPEKNIFKRDLNRKKTRGHRNKEMLSKSREVQLLNGKKNGIALLNLNEKVNWNDPTIEEIPDKRNENILHSSGRKGKKKCFKSQRGRNFSSQNWISDNDDETFYNINDLNLLVDYLQDLRDSKIKSYQSKIMNSAEMQKLNKDSHVMNRGKDTNIYCKKRRKNKDGKLQGCNSVLFDPSEMFDRDENINQIKNKLIKKGLKNKYTQSESDRADLEEYYSLLSENEPEYYEYFDVDSKVFNHEPPDINSLRGRSHMNGKGKILIQEDKMLKPQSVYVDKANALPTSTDSLFSLRTDCIKYVTKKVIANLQNQKGSKLNYPYINKLDKDYESAEYDAKDDSEFKQSTLRSPEERIMDRLRLNGVNKSRLKHYLSKIKRKRNGLEQKNALLNHWENFKDYASNVDSYPSIKEEEGYSDYEALESVDDLADDNDKHDRGPDSETVNFYVFKRPAFDDDSFHFNSNKGAPMKKNIYLKEDLKIGNENQRNFTKERLDSLCDVMSVLQKIPVVEEDTESVVEGECETKDELNRTISHITRSTTTSANSPPSRRVHPSSTEPISTVNVTQTNKPVKITVTTKSP